VSAGGHSRSGPGEKYHRADCRYLAKSKIAISLADAKEKYEPCKVCNPPQ
jgi:micrococcal nuclease